MNEKLKYPTYGGPEPTIRDAAINFEATKYKMYQDPKGNWLLTLRMHPNDLPEPLFRSAINSRWTVAMVQLNELEEPVMTEDQELGIKAVRLAGVLCRDPDFQTYLAQETGAPSFGIDDTTAALRSILGVVSRKELKDDKKAREQFMNIYESFDSWRKNK